MKSFKPEDVLILAVDDMPLNLKIVGSILDRVGYAVTFATSGPQALERLKTAQPDLVLLDLMMPEMNGLQVCQAIKSHPTCRDVPVIFLTASHEQTHLLEAFEYGAVDYVTKPFNASELLARVATHLELKHHRDQLQQQAERERLFSRITECIHQSLELSDILNITVTEVRQFLGTDRVVIGRFTSQGMGQVIAESVPSEWPMMLGKTLVPTQSPDTELPLEQVRLLNHLSAIAQPQPYHKVLSEFQVQSELAVPLWLQNRRWGFLLVHHCQHPRTWQASEIDAVQQFASQLAIAIHQAQLFEQVHQLNASLEEKVHERTAQLQKAVDFEATLKHITDKVRDSLDETQILETVVQAVGTALPVDTCNTGIYSPDLTYSTIAYEYTQTLPPVQGVKFQFADFAEVYDPLRQGNSVEFCWIKSLAARPMPNRVSVLACPMLDNQGVLGDLWLFKATADPFEDVEIRLVQQVANQCAIALRQARLYRAAQAEVEALERLNRLKDDFLSTMSHELRTPLSSIQMATDMLSMLIQQIGNQQAHLDATEPYLRILQEECQREILLVNDLLDLARLDADTEPLLLAPIDLHHFLPYIAEPFLHRSSQQPTLSIDLVTELPLLNTDATVLGRMLTELLNNACKYTPSQGQIQLTAQLYPDRLDLQVRNSGVALAAVEIDRIFDKFYRIPQNDPWKYGGTGLGLALVKKQAAYLNAAIAASCEDDSLIVTLSFPEQSLMSSTPSAC